MKLNESLRKKLMSASVIGAAAAFMAVAPYMTASAADMNDRRPGPPPPPFRAEEPGPGPAMMGPGPIVKGFGFSHRVQAMVRDGKITAEQAMKLNRELDKYERRQAKAHKKFVRELPEKTGISEDTLKELFAPPKRPDRPDRPDRPKPPRHGRGR